MFGTQNSKPLPLQHQGGQRWLVFGTIAVLVWYICIYSYLYIWRERDSPPIVRAQAMFHRGGSPPRQMPTTGCVEYPTGQTRSKIHRFSNPVKTLVTITGAWGNPSYATAERYGMLERQLLNYLQMCEQGFHIDIILMTYSGWDHLKFFHNKEFFCFAQGISLNITVRFWPKVKLPGKTFGTSGTLAFMHRSIFHSNVGKYDYFINQEDDIEVQPKNIHYFMKWERVFFPTNLLPHFLMYEFLQELKPCNGCTASSLSQQTDNDISFDVRFAFYQVIMYREHPLGVSRPSCCLYMVSQQNLQKMIDGGKFLNISYVQGEFNPGAGGSRLVSNYYRMVVPLRDFDAALLHHQPNKYISRSFSLPGIDAYGRNTSGMKTKFYVNPTLHEFRDSVVKCILAPLDHCAYMHNNISTLCQGVLTAHNLNRFSNRNATLWGVATVDIRKKIFHDIHTQIVCKYEKIAINFPFYGKR